MEKGIKWLRRSSKKNWKNCNLNRMKTLKKSNMSKGWFDNFCWSKNWLKAHALKSSFVNSNNNTLCSAKKIEYHDVLKLT